MLIPPVYIFDITKVIYLLVYQYLGSSKTNLDEHKNLVRTFDMIKGIDIIKRYESYTIISITYISINAIKPTNKFYQPTK